MYYDDVSEDIDIYFYEAVRDTDIVVFLSPADGFMSKEDISCLESLVVRFPIIKRENEDFSNLFLTAAQMEPVNPENAAQLEEKFDAGCAELLEALRNPQNAWGKLLGLYNFSNKGFQRLRTRFFAYIADIPDMCLPFYTALAKTLETVPGSIMEHTKRNLQWQIEGYREYVTREVQNRADDGSAELLRERITILNRLLNIFERASS